LGKSSLQVLSPCFQQGVLLSLQRLIARTADGLRFELSADRLVALLKIILEAQVVEKKLVVNGPLHYHGVYGRTFAGFEHKMLIFSKQKGETGVVLQQYIDKSLRVSGIFDKSYLSAGVDEYRVQLEALVVERADQEGVAAAIVFSDCCLNAGSTRSFHGRSRLCLRATYAGKAVKNPQQRWQQPLIHFYPVQKSAYHSFWLMVGDNGGWLRPAGKRKQFDSNFG
jgi:hypothetical protein